MTGCVFALLHAPFIEEWFTKSMASSLHLRHIARPRPALIALALIGTALFFLIGLAVLPSIFPAAGARSADVLRSVIGVQAVSGLESASNRMRDQLNQYRFGHGAMLPQINWTAKAQAFPR